MTESAPTTELPLSGRAPKYLALARRLLHHIAESELQPGQRLGTENTLARKHGVSRVTLRQALAVLENGGYVDRKKAKGTFVARSVNGSWRLGLTRGAVLIVCSNEQAGHADEDLGFASVLRALERGLAKNGFTAQIMGIGEDPGEDRHRLEGLVHRAELEGICVIGPWLEPYREMIPDLPVVAVSGYYSGSTFPLVNVDLAVVARTCTEHLIQKGHRRIALLCGPWVKRAGFRSFAEGYREAFRAGGHRSFRSLMYHAYPGEPLGPLAREVIRGPVRPTAVLADNWKVCEEVLAAAAAEGRKIPDDLSVASYGRNVLRVKAPVAITTYLPDGEGIGEQAAQLLASLIDGAAIPPQPMSIPGRLTEGDSVRIIEPLENAEDTQ